MHSAVRRAIGVPGFRSRRWTHTDIEHVPHPDCRTAVARISQDCAQRFIGFAVAVRDRVATAPIQHVDQTGFRITGKTQWPHIASTIWLSFYRVSVRRGRLRRAPLPMGPLPPSDMPKTSWIVLISGKI